MTGAIYVPPVTLAPIVTARRVTIEPTYMVRAKRLKSVAYPDLPCKMPQGANGAVKAILNRDDLTLIVTYARGYAVKADGTQQQETIWQANVPNEDDDRVRIAVGKHPATAVDSVLVRGYQRDADGLTRVLMGHWVDGSYENGCDWHRAVLIENLTATAFEKRVKHG